MVMLMSLLLCSMPEQDFSFFAGTCKLPRQIHLFSVSVCCLLTTNNHTCLFSSTLTSSLASLSESNSSLSLSFPMNLLQEGMCSSAADWNCNVWLSCAPSAVSYHWIHNHIDYRVPQDGALGKLKREHGEGEGDVLVAGDVSEDHALHPVYPHLSISAYSCQGQDSIRSPAEHKHTDKGTHLRRRETWQAYFIITGLSFYKALFIVESFHSITMLLIQFSSFLLLFRNPCFSSWLTKQNMQK